MIESVLSKGNTGFLYGGKNMMTILETRELRKIYGSGNTEVRALDGVNLSVEKAELCAGTHVDNTSNISAFKIVSESGVMKKCKLLM